MTPVIVTLTGPSCAGKSTLEDMLERRGFAAVVSTTTRPMRFGEVDGASYYFVSDAEFDATPMIESVKFGTARYGVSVAEIERVATVGKPIVIVVEPDGRDQIGRYCDNHDWHHHPIYVGADEAVIARRFLTRFTQELLIAEDDAQRDAIIARYAPRMAIMMTLERSWAEEAHRQMLSMDDAPYGRLLGKFDGVIAESYADDIAAEIKWFTDFNKAA